MIARLFHPKPLVNVSALAATYAEVQAAREQYLQVPSR